MYKLNSLHQLVKICKFLTKFWTKLVIQESGIMKMPTYWSVAMHTTALEVSPAVKIRQRKTICMGTATKHRITSVDVYEA